MKNYKIIELLKWDSDFFGIKVGKIQLVRGNFEKSKFVDEQNEEHYDLIYGFSSADKTSNGFWELLGFHLADCPVTVSMKFDLTKYKNLEYECCTGLSKNDVKACYEIAEMIAPVSRFYREPTIGRELTKKMYRKWIDTALDGSFSDYLFVERVERKIVGIHAIKTDNNVGIFTLTGVRDGFTGQGMGRRLWGQSFSYWANNTPKVNLIRSRFSINNIPSFNFHIAMGFNIVESVNHIYHYSKRHDN